MQGTWNGKVDTVPLIIRFLHLFCIILFTKFLQEKTKIATTAKWKMILNVSFYSLKQKNLRWSDFQIKLMKFPILYVIYTLFLVYDSFFILKHAWYTINLFFFFLLKMSVWFSNALTTIGFIWSTNGSLFKHCGSSF